MSYFKTLYMCIILSVRVRLIVYVMECMNKKRYSCVF